MKFHYDSCMELNPNNCMKLHPDNFMKLHPLSVTTYLMLAELLFHLGDRLSYMVLLHDDVFCL